MNDLAGRVALVTGGGRDVGAAISLDLAAKGAAVAVNYHSSKDEAEAIVAQIRKAGGKLVSLIPVQASLEDFFLKQLEGEHEGKTELEAIR